MLLTNNRIFFVILVSNRLVCQILSLLHINAADGVSSQLCPEKMFQCQCGYDINWIVTLKLQCSYFYQWEHYCTSCDEWKEKDVCRRYNACKLCETNRCTACPFNRFGQWCEKDCKCENGADCDINGFCQCVNGYEGRFCENNTGICQDPGPLPNGYAEFEGEIKGFQKGAVIKYHCAELHYLSGEATSVCSENATWTNTKPRCIKPITCSYPRIPKYGRLKVQPLDGNLSQNGGIKRSRIGRPNFPRKRSTCSNNIKTTIAYRSKRMTNATLVSMTGVQPTNLANSTSGNRISIKTAVSNRNISDTVILPEGQYPVGTRVSYECESRYYDIVGSQNRLCQSDATWSGRDVTCEPMCGTSDSPKIPFIKNGNATEIGQWPWQVGISLFLEEHNEWYLQCGGSLISESLVLTAAHCVNDHREKSRLANLKFHFGKYHRNNNLDDDMVQARNAKEIYVHHNYDPKTFDSDIAVVLLDVPVTLTSRVQPICLPTDRSTRVNIVDGRTGIVTGWGRLDENGKDSETLQQAVIPVVGHEKCENGYQSAGLRFTIPENMFCAGYDNRSVDACPGDSGGPMVFEGDSARGKKFVLEGIVSWGSPNGCGQPQQHGVLIWVHKFLPWIMQFV